MMMAACYANYDMSHQQQHALHIHHQDHQQQQQQSRLSSVAAVLAAAAASATIIPSQTDYNIPLHVDCSVEYELPNQPKPPAGERVEPLLMIHPCYFRKMESQRRSPFINNMPNSSRTNVILNGGNNTSSRRTTRQSHIIQHQQQQQQEQNHRQHQQQQQQQQRYPTHHHVHSNSQHHHSLILGQQIQNQMSQMSQQAHYPVVTNIQKHQPSSLSSEYSEQNIIRRNSIIQNRTTTTTTTNNNNNNNQKLTNWDKNSNSIAIVTSLPQQTTGISGIQPAESVNLSGKTIYSKPVGKRDAMISGGCISNINNNNNNNNSNNKLIDQHNNNNNNNLNRHIKINSNSTGCIALSSDSTNLKIWESSNTIINRSPMATVPSNYQAGPETTLTPITNNNINNNNNNNSRNDEKINNGKYRQYLRAHRNHPYIITTAKAISSGHIYPQQLSTVTASFPQLQQMSCYNA